MNHPRKVNNQASPVPVPDPPSVGLTQSPRPDSSALTWQPHTVDVTERKGRQDCGWPAFRLGGWLDGGSAYPGLAVLVEDEQVGLREMLTICQIDQVGDGAAVHGREQGEQVWGGPAAEHLGAVAGPVL